jgi:hypothetical protein
MIFRKWVRVSGPLIQLNLTVIILHSLWMFSEEPHKDSHLQVLQVSNIYNFSHLISDHPHPTPTLTQSWISLAFQVFQDCLVFLFLLGMRTYFYFPFQRFYWWKIDIEDHFLRAWRWLTFKKLLVMQRSQAKLAFLERSHNSLKQLYLLIPLW